MLADARYAGCDTHLVPAAVYRAPLLLRLVLPCALLLMGRVPPVRAGDRGGGTHASGAVAITANY